MLKLNVDSLEAVDEPLRALYEPDGDKFKLKVEGLEDTAGLKSALQKERKTAGELQKQTNAWKALGKTPEEIQELLEAQEARQQTEAERKGEWEKLRTQMNDKHAKDLQTKDETIGAMRRRLEAELVDAKATAAIASAKGVPELLLPIVHRFVKVDDDFNVQIVDAKGDPRVNGKGEPLSISDLITEMKATELYGRAFDGSGQTGGGKQPDNTGGGNPRNNKKRSEFTKEERIAFIDANGGGASGYAAWSALPR